MRLIYVFLLSVFFNTAIAKPLDIVWWHSFAGQLGVEVQRLAEAFNQSQNEYRVKPVYKGGYIETLSAFAAAFHAKQAPVLIQVFEVGTPTMLRPKGIIKPTHELMQEGQESLPVADFFPAVRAFYSENGHLMAMPFNISIPVMFYNKTVLAKLGYADEQSFPKTWKDLEHLAIKLRKAGFACAYTSAYPAWTLIESYAALHGIPFSDLQLQHGKYHHPALVQHVERLRRWQKMHYFEYGGRQDGATVLFTSGRCPILSQSSGAYHSLSEMVSFPVGMAVMPLDETVSQHRFNNVTGGAAIWAIAGQKPAVYRGVARFFAFLAQPDVQRAWHERTGYLPLGVEGHYAALFSKNEHSALALAKKEWAQEVPPGIARLNAQNQIRMIHEEALEVMFAGIKTPKEAMDDAMLRASRVLRRVYNTGVG